MSKRKFLRAGSAIWLACAALPVAAGEFAPPAEGPVMFRRDQVPLDVETMASLSRQLVPMAAGINRESPASRRSSAQMLALAIALDPANSAAREMIAALRDNRPVAPADPEKITRSQGRVWQYIGWLETREAGPQGQALAACLADVMVASDPGHPRAKELAAAGERGTWTGWVPEIAAYQEKPAAGPPPDEPDEAESPSPLLAAASVATPLWTKAGAAEDAPWVLAPGAIEMAANRSQDPETAELPLSLAIGSGEEGGSYPKMSRMITGLLEKQHGALPTGVSIRIGGKALEASMASEKRQTISAAAAVLANAAVTGREPEAMVIGLVDADGNFTLPAGFWQQLQALRGGDGTRLVLPAAAEEFLPSLLAMEKPQFFLDHQVLLASNFSDLVALVDKTPSLEIESALAKFREIRAKSENQSIGPYVANSFVRRRLAEVAAEAPYHFSARMLAIQGAGDRPVFIPRTVLASEIRTAIEPMRWLLTISSSELTEAHVNALAATYDTCRSRVEALGRYAEKKDRGLLELSADMLTGIRTIDRAARSRSDDVQSLVVAAHDGVVRAHGALMGELEKADPDPENPPGS